MTYHQYRVTGWMFRRPHERAYWAEFGYYATLEAAQLAVQTLSADGSVLQITLDGRTIETYRNGEPAETQDELSFLAHLTRVRDA